MIVRIFKARIKPGREAEFERFLNETGIPLVKRAEGALGVVGARQIEKPRNEYVVASGWQSLDALVKFAGADWRQPYIRPEEADLIEQVSCDHYEVVAQ